MTGEWQSTKVFDSETWPGVTLVIGRMSFARRLELMKRVRDLALRADFFDAGREEKNHMEASLLGAEIDRLYLEWGLREIRGLRLDDEPATCRGLIELGPEDLVAEALALVKAECGLNENERKN